ncbi:hypothetical protein [Parasphingorhabdus pacifica]
MRRSTAPIVDINRSKRRWSRSLQCSRISSRKRCIYDHVIDEIATSTVEALKTAATDATAMTRAALGNIVQKIIEDPRRAAGCCSRRP